MLFSAFAVLALFGAAQAKPAPKVLEFDDVLVLREDGNHVVMKKWDYSLEEDKREVQRRKALVGRAPETSPAAKIDARCEESTEVQVLVDEHFNNWDVSMSPVIGNTGSSTASVAVAKGYSIADSISVTETVGVTLESILTASLALQYSNTYTTTDTQTFSFNVPDGQYGVVISNPYTHRVAGNVLSGCTDSPSSDAFQWDTYTSQSFGDLEWVQGPISMCNSSTYPVPFCVGSGTHE